MTFWFLSSSSLRRVNKELRSRNFMDSKEEEKINKINTKQEKKKKMNKTHRDEGDDDARCRRRRRQTQSQRREGKEKYPKTMEKRIKKEKKKEEGPFSFILSSCPAALVCMCVCTYVFVEICARCLTLFFLFLFQCYISDSQTPYLHVQPFTQINKQKTNFEYTKNVSLEKKTHTTTTKWIKILKEFLEKLFPSPDFFFGSANERTNEESPHTRKKKMVEVTPRLDSSHIIVGTRPPRLSLFPNVYHNFKKNFRVGKKKKKRRKVDNHLRKRRHGVQSERRKKKKTAEESRKEEEDNDDN